jgi:cysteine-rich repeat protein
MAVRSSALVACVLAVAGASPGEARSGRQALLTCRHWLAETLRVVIRASLERVASCHDAVHGPRSTVDCNAVATTDEFLRAQARARGIIPEFCQGGNPVLDNYPTGVNPAVAVAASIARRITASGEALQALTRLPAGRSARVPRRCVHAIGHARTALATRIVARAVRCQAKIDRRATVLGAIAPACLGTAPRTAARVRRKLARACHGIAGVEIGSCDPLPDCVITSVTALGQALARDIYGALPDQRGQLCGNGEVDTGEECDDGNQDDHDACTKQCLKARCGDGIVETGVEECDDGNNIETDACTPQCKRARCGDGIVEAGVEECDDGPANGMPGDPCGSDCRFAQVACSGSGQIQATLTLVPAKDGSTDSQFAGIQTTLGYPSGASIPGSGSLPVGDPENPATRIVLLAPDLYRGLIAFTDTDTALVTIAAASAVVQLGNAPLPFERVTFDCAAGATFTPSEFPCSVTDESGPLGNEIGPGQRPACIVRLAAP